jgi:hypothetical protein
MAVSRSVAFHLKRNATKTRQAYIKPKLVDGVLAQELDLGPDLFGEGLQLDYDAVDLATVPIDSESISAPSNDEGIPEGSLILRDPALEYLISVPEDEIPKQLYQLSQEAFVAVPSAPLRVIFPVIAGKQRVECIVDSGSQIVSMSKAIAEKLGVTWDTEMQIFMQSANGQMKQSYGLARNVLFQFGDVRAHLQVHIFEKPAYDVLLGRPFEVLTRSSSSNDGSGGCTLTITDPNTRKTSTMVTYARGSYKVPTVEEVPDEDLLKPSRNLGSENERPNGQGF